MADPNIIKFISEQLAAGYSEVQVREALKSKNWQDSDIDAAFNEWKANPTLPEKKIVGRFIGESWEVYKSLFPTLAKVFLKLIGKSLLFAIPVIVLFALGQVLKNQGQAAGNILSVIAMVLAACFIIVILYYMVWMQIAMVLVIKNRRVGITPNDAISQAKPLIGAYFWASFLSGILTVLWTLLLIIPGIIYGVYYTFAEYITLDTPLRGYEAVKLSKKYVEGMWWQVFSSMLGLIAVSVIIYIIDLALKKIGGEYVGGVVQGIANLLYFPYSLIYVYLVYERLQVLKPEVAASVQIPAAPTPPQTPPETPASPTPSTPPTQTPPSSPTPPTQNPPAINPQ